MEPSELPRHFLNRCTTAELTDLLDFADEHGLAVVAVEHVGRRPNRKSDREWVIVTKGGVLISPASRGAFSFV